MLKKSLFFIFTRGAVTVIASVICLLLSWEVCSSMEKESRDDTCCPGERHAQVFKLTIPYMYDEEIEELQEVFRELGCYQGKINGVFDPATEAAVKTFQKKHGIKHDGVIGIETRKMLIRIFEKEAIQASAAASPKGKVEIVIDTKKRTLTVYDDNKKFKTFHVAVGKERTPTPVGEWKITRKALDWGNGFGTRWLNLNVPWGIYGIHGTNKPWSIGTRASKGCIRMFNRDVEQVFQWVKVGTTVRITGQIYPLFYEDRKVLCRGSKGSDVLLIQKGLIAEGYLKPPVDGIFGRGTEQALKRLQKERGFEVTGQVDVDIWPVLGL